MASPSEVGQKTLAAVLSALVESGYIVSIPFGEGTPYDLVIDSGDRLLKAQCKTGRLRNGAVLFPSSKRVKKWSAGTIAHESYGEKIDVFLVFCPETGLVYWVPPSDVSEGMGTLRVKPARNGQEQGIRWASVYELKPAAVHLDL